MARYLEAELQEELGRLSGNLSTAKYGYLIFDPIVRQLIHRMFWNLWHNFASKCIMKLKFGFLGN